MKTKDLNLPIELDRLRQILKEYGVVEAHVFGSYGRGDFTANSDLDLLVTLEKDRSLFDLGGLQYRLDELLPVDVDVMTKVNPRLKPYIEDDLMKIL